MSKIFIRLDDASEYMHLDNWTKVIRVLDNYRVRCVIAVIPNCEDEMLKTYGVVDNWQDLVKKWSHKHEIALHGYNHVYEYRGKSSIRSRRNSEFAGAPIHIQNDKIVRGLDLFKKLSIPVRFFVAPGHSLDANTINLASKHGLIVYDGFFPTGVTIKGVKYFPLHFASLRYNILGSSICLHPNTMTDRDFDALDKFLNKYSDKITDIRSVKFPVANRRDIYIHNIINLIFKAKFYVRNTRI